MRLRDRLYFKFGLFHKRHSRMLFAFLEGFLVGLVLLVSLMALYGGARLLTWIYYINVAEAVHEKVQQVEREKVGYERIVLACLNREWFVANGELFTCEAK